jgi:hypothetical protein
VHQKRKDIGWKLEEVYDGSRKMTLWICFEDGGVLNEDAMNAVMSYNNSKKREWEEKDEQKQLRMLLCFWKWGKNHQNTL